MPTCIAHLNEHHSDHIPSITSDIERKLIQRRRCPLFLVNSLAVTLLIYSREKIIHVKSSMKLETQNSVSFPSSLNLQLSIPVIQEHPESIIRLYKRCRNVYELWNLVLSHVRRLRPSSVNIGLVAFLIFLHNEPIPEHSSRLTQRLYKERWSDDRARIWMLSTH